MPTNKKSKTAKTIFDRIDVSGFTPWSIDNDVAWQPEGGVGLGVGRGEDRIVWEFKKLGRAANTVGGSEQYDIIEANGRRWEVKEPDSSLSIRPGVAGRAATAELTKKIKEIAGVLLHAFTLVAGKEARALLTSRLNNDRLASEWLSVNDIELFLWEAITNIEKGEISHGLFFGKTRTNPFGLYDIVKLVSSFIDERRDLKATSVKFAEHPRTRKLVELHDVEHFDDLVRRYISDEKETGLEQSISRMDSLRKLEATQEDFFAARLRDERVMLYLTHPSLLLELWENSASPLKTFDCVDGVIIVSKDEGFAIIPRADLNKKLIFSRITQHNSRFKIVKK